MSSTAHFLVHHFNIVTSLSAGTSNGGPSETESDGVHSLVRFSIVDLDLKLVDELWKNYVTEHDDLDSEVFLAQQLRKSSLLEIFLVLLV